ncbi:hypothetical protein C6497_16900 [Candidatus Poribacteria bacterium]|nr:MAG: hypothetical protein C6497_16900 [Candidatus Poribacteria bacterium]
MQKRICIINLSAPEIEITVLANCELEEINFTLPWKVGFRQQEDGTLLAFIGDEVDRLDANNSNEVLFSDLDIFIRHITDPETLALIFSAYCEEIFQQRLSKEALSVYVITPYQWQFVHRHQLRKILKSTINNIQDDELNPPNVIFRGMINQILCLINCYRKNLEELLVDTSELQFFLIDIARQDVILYQLFCKKFSVYVSVELSNVFRFPDYILNTPKLVSDINKECHAVEETVPVVFGFSGRIDDGTVIIEELKSHCDATFFEPQGGTTLLGGTKLIQHFSEKSDATPIHFIYRFCFGVQLPNGKRVELVPKTWTPPYNSKRAFRVTGSLNKIHIPLFCGMSLTDSSDVHHLTTIEIDYSNDDPFATRNTDEIILSITLNDATHGTFKAIFSSPREPISIDFTVPVLMD